MQEIIMPITRLLHAPFASILWLGFDCCVTWQQLPYNSSIGWYFNRKRRPYGKAEIPLAPGKQFAAIILALFQPQRRERQRRHVDVYVTWNIIKIDCYEQHLVAISTQVGVMPVRIKIAVIDIHQVEELPIADSFFSITQR